MRLCSAQTRKTSDEPNFFLPVRTGALMSGAPTL